MARYVWPGRCLDCGAAVGTTDLRCGMCGLVQTGQQFDELRRVLLVADGMLDRLRDATPAMAPPAAIPPAPGPGSVAQPPVASAPTSLPPAEGLVRLRPAKPPRLPAMSTAMVLLTLGALCLLVAAFVFVTVAWSDLSLAARAAILLAVTGVIAGVGWWATRKSLLISAEVFSSLSVLMVLLDFVAARYGGLAGIDTLSLEAAQWTGGGLLVATGTAWAVFGSHSTFERLVGAQVGVGLGWAYLSLLAVAQLPGREEFRWFAVTVAMVVVTGWAARAALWFLAGFTAVLSSLWLLAAVVSSLRRVAEAATVQELWGHAEVAGWLVCCGLAFAATRVRLLPDPARAAAGAGALLGITLVVLRPIEGSSFDVLVLALIAAAVVQAGLSLVASPVWVRAGGAAAVVTGTLASACLLPAVALAVARIMQPSDSPWTWQPGDEVDRVLDPMATWWVVGGATFALGAVGWVVVRRALPPTWYAGVAIAAAGTLAGLQLTLPLWAVVTILGVPVAAAGLLVAWRRGSIAAQVAFGISQVLMLTAASGSAWTTAVTALLLAVLAVALAYTSHGPVYTDALTAWAGLLTGLSAAACSDLVGVDSVHRGVVVIGTGIVAAGVAQLRVAHPPLRGRLGLEGSAVVLCGAGIGLTRPDPVTLSLALTIVGAAMVGVSLVSSDRRWTSVPGGVLLAVASWVRLAYEDVSIVEAYTLPSALVLVALGLWHLGRHPERGTVLVLAPGLTLAMLPSLVRTLPDPTSPRALALGIAALALATAGAVLRWAAPLVAGSLVVGVLAVLNLAPYAAALPRWVIFAAAGAALLFMGTTWERRLGDLRRLGGVLERLR